MGPIEQLRNILPTIDGIVDRIGVDDLDAATPCDEFTVHDVLDHMIVLGGAFAGLFRGDAAQPGTVPPVYGRVPAREFHQAMGELLDAIESDGALDRELETPLGTMSGETFARAVAVDGLVHGWDLAVATRQRYVVEPELVAAVHAFAEQALSEPVRATGMFAPATTAPPDASPIEELVALTGRSVDERWRPTPRALHLDAASLPAKIDVPGALARQVTSFGDVTGYGSMAGEYFSLGAGTDIAPLLVGLDHDSCHCPHWGFVVTGRLVVTFDDGSEVTCRGGEIFYWPPGHSVRVEEDADVVLFSPEAEHVAVLDHMLASMAAAS